MKPFFLLIGQSNMAGRGNLDELPPEEKAIDGIHILRQGAWQEASHPLQDPDDPVFSVKADRQGGVGPGLAFARAMRRDSDETVGLLLCAKGGTGIAAWARGGELYTAMKDRLGLAARQRRLAGALIHVGEGDTKSEQTALVWIDAFHSLVADLRADAGEPTLPVVFAQLATIAPERRARKEHGHAGWDRLKHLQTAVDAPNIAMVTSDDLPLKADGLHLSTAAAISLGERFAEAMKRLLHRGVVADRIGSFRD